MKSRLLAAAAAWGLLASGAAAPAQSTTRPLLCEAAVQAIDASAARTLAQGSPGMIVEVARDGEVLFSGTYGYANLEQPAPITRQTVFKLASITKEFTAATILLLAQDGKLRLDDKLSHYVPEFPNAERVTLYQLLVQTSGIPDYAEDPSGTKTKSVARTPEEMAAWIAQLTPAFQFEPGTRWAYSNSNYALLGLVAERAGGKPLAEQFEERLFRPAGMTATDFDDPADVVEQRAAGYRRSRSARSGFVNAAWISPTIPGPAGGLRGTAEDLVRWSHALFGGRILGAGSLQTMIAPGLLDDGRTTKLGMPVAWQEGLDSDYGMGVFVKRSPAGLRIGHSGGIDGFSTWVAHYPESGITIVHMINSESADMHTDAIEDAVFSGPGEPCLRTASAATG